MTTDTTLDFPSLSGRQALLVLVWCGGLCSTYYHYLQRPFLLIDLATPLKLMIPCSHYLLLDYQQFNSYKCHCCYIIDIYLPQILLCSNINSTFVIWSV